MILLNEDILLQARYGGEKVKLSITNGNSKLSRDIFSFSLTPIKGCLHSKVCRRYCYCIRYYKAYREVRKAYDGNLELSKRADFARMLIDRLKLLKRVKAFRLHVSGDFYNIEYYLKWVKAINAFPKMTFYGYTKNFDVHRVGIPSNLILIYTKVGRRVTPEKARLAGFNGYCEVVEKWKEGFRVCTGIKGNMFCGITCDYCFTSPEEFKKVAFFKKGRKEGERKRMKRNLIKLFG